MSQWSMAQARSTLKKLMLSAKKEPQILANRGEPVAVLLDFDAYNELQKKSRKPLAPLWEKLDRLVRQAKEKLELPKIKMLQPKNPFKNF